MDKYDYPLITASFRDRDGDLADPEVVKFGIKSPDGVTTIYVYGTDDEIVRVDTGVYSINILVDQAGTWCWRWRAIGNPTSSEEGCFSVDQAKVNID